MAYGTIRADIIQGTNVTIDLSVAGQYEFAGDLFPDADSTRDLGSNTLRWQTLYVDAISAAGHLTPSANNTYNLGSSGLQWANLYVTTIDAFSAGGSITPSADSTHDLGTDSVRWANVYADNIYSGDLHLKNDRGDWTVIEESDYLSLRNNKTGKTFRLLMEEVDS